MCEKYINWLPLVCAQLGTWPTTQACGLTGTRTSDPLALRVVFNLLSHTSQGTFLLNKDHVETSAPVHLHTVLSLMPGTLGTSNQV